MNTPSHPLLRRTGLWLAAGWLAVLVIIFYVLRNPFFGSGGVILRNVLDTLAVISLVWLGGALGALILPEPGRFTALERAAIQALLGLGAVALIVLALGVIGWYPPGWLAWLITLAGLAILFRHALRWLGALRVGLGEAFQVQTGNDHRPLLRTVGGWVILGTLALLVMAVIPALAPPSDWDSLVYHLAGPRLYIQAGRIIPFPELHFLGFPFLTEMLYLWLMLIARSQAGALLHAIFGVLAAMLLVGMGRRMNRPLAGWIALLALLIGNEIQNEFQTAYSDLSAAAFATGGLWFVLAAFEDDAAPDRRSLIWGGVMVGLALGTKYTAISAAVGLGLVTLWLARRGGPGGMLRAGVTLTGPALVVFSPWLIKNALIYGNPVAPFVWGTSGFDQIDQVDYLHAGSGLTPLELIAYPLIFTFLGGVGDWRIFGSPGPLLPGLLPLSLVGWKARPQAERTLIVTTVIFAAVGLAYWALGAGTTSYLISLRLIYPFFPAVALAGALGLEGLSEQSLPVPVERVSRIALLAAALASPVIVGLAILRVPDPLRVTFGQMAEKDYLTEMLPAYHDAIQQVNALPPDARVLMLWESRTFYCQRDCIPDSLLNQWRHDHLVDPDPHKAVERWRAKGIDYVLICDAGMNAAFTWNERGPELLKKSDVDALQQVRDADLKLLWSDVDTFKAYSLYQIR